MPTKAATDGLGSSLVAVWPSCRPRKPAASEVRLAVPAPDLADTARHRHQCRRWSAADVSSCSARPRPAGHKRRPGNVGGALRRGDRIECALGHGRSGRSAARLAGDGIGPNAETEARGRRRFGGRRDGGGFGRGGGGGWGAMGRREKTGPGISIQCVNTLRKIAEKTGGLWHAMRSNCLSAPNMAGEGSRNGTFLPSIACIRGRTPRQAIRAATGNGCQLAARRCSTRRRQNDRSLHSPRSTIRLRLLAKPISVM